MNSLPWLVIFIILLWDNPCSFAKPQFVEIWSGKEECFYEHYNTGEPIEFLYVVRHGGRHDIEMRLFDPMNRMIERRVTNKYDRYYLPSALASGMYKICLNNAMSRWTNKVAGIELLGNHRMAIEHYNNLAKQRNLGKITDDVLQIVQQMDTVEDMQAVGMDVEEAFWEEIMSSSSTVAYMTMIEGTALFLTYVFQIRQIRLWFKGGKEGFGV
ncbi:hypothetical protein RFI_14251 [Reticulomyxa filosa]|uniref:GOLD domain-containing protein n=1 Tax=Reticulomyxa filosa TaxID=46433 RepID=X6NAM7_RETFI|nr:hypothetical protein RFI_14251 [Reticulomyxa filosa]|eukprot:ETO22938.1 hypothetical protein RFI_14251 [Reticulomyxa filosa]